MFYFLTASDARKTGAGTGYNYNYKIN